MTRQQVDDSYFEKWNPDVDWSNPSIVMHEYESPNEGLWTIWCDGVYCVIDDENYEIVYLTSS